MPPPNAHSTNVCGPTFQISNPEGKETSHHPRTRANPGGARRLARAQFSHTSTAGHPGTQRLQPVKSKQPSGPEPRACCLLSNMCFRRKPPALPAKPPILRQRSSVLASFGMPPSPGAWPRRNLSSFNGHASNTKLSEFSFKPEL